jgi:hypothetical protein
MDISITLGERVLDAAAGKSRDVDIVLARSGSTALFAVEVKAEGSPLDVITVESLCAKLNDMPSLETKQIVSYSGFTKPAIRKAEYHGVECLNLVNGRVPPFEPLDLSSLRTWEHMRREWLEHNTRFLVPEGTHSSIVHRLANDLSSSAIKVRQGSVTLSVPEFRNAVLDKVTHRLAIPPASGEYPVDQTVELVPTAMILVDAEEVAITHCEIKGRVRVSSVVIPIDNSVYLERQNGSPLAGAALVETPEGLFGVSVTAGVQGLTVFAIPEALRAVTPHKEIIRLNVAP